LNDQPGGRCNSEWVASVLTDQVKVKLPNGINAVVDVVKLRDYCLNPGHPEGRHKARVFRATLGMEREDAEALRPLLLAAARDQDAEATEADEYGERYVLDSSLRYTGREARVRSAWIIRKGENFPRLTSRYVL
jgi:Domain of unknown function (DUF6883)